MRAECESQMDLARSPPGETDVTKAKKICVFCGGPPVDKNKEHVLPMWLLEFTGDPTRSVIHGFSWNSGKAFEYAFSDFTFPSCTACNTSYAEFEGKAKAVVESICRKEAVDPRGYVTLLDWLDKVRIGMWLGHRYLQKAEWEPSFTIDSRIARKDRMIAVYPVGDHQTGLNVYNAESPLFHYKPSVFSLRVNNILFLNASWDWMCSSRCAFPYPRYVRHSKAVPGALVTGDYTRKQTLAHPVMAGLMKSCVTLFQPIMQRDKDGTFAHIPQDQYQYVAQNGWDSRIGQGPLYRQFAGQTLRINADDPPIEFDSILADEARRAIDIATQAYWLQNIASQRDSYLYDDGTYVKQARSMRLLEKVGTKQMRAFRRQTGMAKTESSDQNTNGAGSVT
jgi:hypothetical protein